MAFYFAIAFPFAFVFGCLMLWFARPADQRLERLILLAIGMLFAQWTVGLALTCLRRLNLPTYDLYVYRIDGLLGVEPSFYLGRLIRGHGTVFMLFSLVYDSMLAAVTVLLAWRIWTARPVRSAIELLLANSVLAIFLYMLFPVCGPRFAFSGFPSAQLLILPRTVHLLAPPNGVPSVHLSTALLIWWFCRESRWPGILAALYAVLTAVVILSLGEHYLFDLIVAIPYTSGLLWLTGARDANPRRVASIDAVQRNHGACDPVARNN